MKIHIYIYTHLLLHLYIKHKINQFENSNMTNQDQRSEIETYLQLAWMGFVIIIVVIIVKTLQWFRQHQLRNEAEEAAVVAHLLNFDSVNDETEKERNLRHLNNLLMNFFMDQNQSNAREVSHEQGEDDCIICLERLFDVPSRTVIASKPCSHLFHLCCITERANIDVMCPICCLTLDEFVLVAPEGFPDVFNDAENMV